MQMVKKIVWSSFAEEDFNIIIEYILKNWSNTTANQFIDLVDYIVKQISFQPKMYPIIHKRLKIRKCVLTQQNSLYYRESKELIEILRIYDNRQNPAKVKFKKADKD